VEKAVEHFVAGLFQNQDFPIGDRTTQAHFTVQTAEILPEPEFKKEAVFTCLSPMCPSQTVAGKEHPQYLPSQLPEYEQYFIYNLLHKYIAANGLSETAESLRYQREWNSPITLGILGEPKSRLVRIKAGTAQENFIRGYTYLFKLNAPPELLRFGYHAGFGEKNSMGFGCVGTLLINSSIY
jgi:CRISPR-associated endoribonuclease Cas6